MQKHAKWVAVLLGVGAATIVIPAAANATSAPNQSTCAVNTHHDLSDVRTDKDGTATNGQATLLKHGVKVVTGDDPAKVYTKFLIPPLPATPTSTPTLVPLTDVTAMSYKTWKYNTSTDPSLVVLPSYQVEVFLSGSATAPAGWTGPNYTTLVYEPYQDQGNAAIHEDTWQTWDAYQSGNGKWWSTHALTAIPLDNGQSTPEKWSDIVNAYPEAALFDYGLNQGTFNAGGVTAFSALMFSSDSGCVTHYWSTKKTPPSPAPSSSSSQPATPPSGTPSGTPTGTPSSTRTSAPPTTATPSGSSTPTLTGDGGDLPTTGSPTALFIGVGVVLLAAGALLMVLPRLRRQRS